MTQQPALKVTESVGGISEDFIHIVVLVNDEHTSHIVNSGGAVVAECGHVLMFPTLANQTARVECIECHRLYYHGEE